VRHGGLGDESGEHEQDGEPAANVEDAIEQMAARADDVRRVACVGDDRSGGGGGVGVDVLRECAKSCTRSATSYAAM
jgi:hypothetical protein